MAKSHGEEIAIGFMIGIFFAILLGLLYSNNIFINKFIMPVANTTSTYYGNFYYSNMLESYGKISKWEVGNVTLNSLVLGLNMDAIIGGYVIDSSPYNNDGLVSGATITTGYLNNALSFDGNNDKVTLGNIITPISGFTVTCWVIPTVINTDTQLSIVTKRDSGITRAWSLGINANSKMRFDVWDSSGSVVSRTGDTDLVALTPYLLVATSNSSVLSIYLNGVSDAIPITCTGFNNVTATTYIGYEVENGRYFNGVIDEVYIYDRALNVTEINQIYLGTYYNVFYEIWDGLILKYQGLINPNILDYTPILLSITELQFIVIILWLLIGIVVWSFRS